MLALYHSDVPLSCINEAAYEYHIPAKLIISVLNVERGRAGLAVRNKNGTYDLGPMQINSGAWWPMLYKYDITPREVLYNPCRNVSVGTWILAKAISNGQDLFSGIGNYHSAAPYYNKSYKLKVKTLYTGLLKDLKAEKSFDFTA